MIWNRSFSLLVYVLVVVLNVEPPSFGATNLSGFIASLRAASQGGGGLPVVLSLSVTNSFDGSVFDYRAILQGEVLREEIARSGVEALYEKEVRLYLENAFKLKTEGLVLTNGVNQADKSKNMKAATEGLVSGNSEPLISLGLFLSKSHQAKNLECLADVEIRDGQFMGEQVLIVNGTARSVNAPGSFLLEFSFSKSDNLLLCVVATNSAMPKIHTKIVANRSNVRTNEFWGYASFQNEAWNEGQIIRKEVVSPKVEYASSPLADIAELEFPRRSFVTDYRFAKPITYQIGNRPPSDHEVARMVADPKFNYLRDATAEKRSSATKTRMILFVLFGLFTAGVVSWLFMQRKYLNA